MNYPNGAYTTYEYDANDRLIAVKNYAKGGKLITSNELQRNDVGDITHITRVDYVKPDLSRIKPNHFTYNEFNQIVSSDEGEFTYDDNGNLLSYIYNGKKINLSYDLADRLIKAEIGADTYEYTYDAEGNRVAVTKNGETKRYLIDNVLGLSKPLAEMDENNNILRYYIWTAKGLTYSVDKDGNIYVYFYDYKGNTNAVIDENNQLVAAYTYSVYGKILGSYEKAGFESPFKFLGKFGIMSDSDELYYIRARYYSPDLARWTQPDILKGMLVNPFSFNRYLYVSGNPVNAIDINGLYTIVLLSPKAAGGQGHAAILVEDRKTGKYFYATKASSAPPQSQRFNLGIELIDNFLNNTDFVVIGGGVRGTVYDYKEIVNNGNFDIQRSPNTPYEKILVIDTTEQQEKKMRNYIKSEIKKGWGVTNYLIVGRNCGDFVEDVLDKGLGDVVDHGPSPNYKYIPWVGSDIVENFYEQLKEKGYNVKIGSMADIPVPKSLQINVGNKRK